MSDVVDLDALAPPTVTVHFNGQDIELQAPTTATVIKLGSLGQKLQNVTDLSDAQIDATVKQLTDLVNQAVPQLGNQALQTAQLLKLVEIISEMAVPPDTKELQKRGISVDQGTDSPKAP